MPLVCGLEGQEGWKSAANIFHGFDCKTFQLLWNSDHLLKREANTTTTSLRCECLTKIDYKYWLPFSQLLKVDCNLKSSMCFVIMEGLSCHFRSARCFLCTYMRDDESSTGEERDGNMWMEKNAHLSTDKLPEPSLPHNKGSVTWIPMVKQRVYYIKASCNNIYAEFPWALSWTFRK